MAFVLPLGFDLKFKAMNVSLAIGLACPSRRLLARSISFTLVLGWLAGAQAAQPAGLPEAEQDADAQVQAPEAGATAEDAAAPSASDNQGAAAAQPTDAQGLEAQDAPPPAEQDVASQAPAPIEGALSEDDGTGRRSRAQKHLKVAVVPMRRWAAKGFELAVANVLMEPIAHRTDLIPFADVRRAVARLNVTPNQLHLPSTLRLLGRRLGADFVMVVEPAGKPRSPFLFVALVDVHSGETPVAKRVPMPGGKVRPGHGDIIMPAIEAALGLDAPSAPEPAQEPAAAEAQTPVADARHDEDKALGADPEPAGEPSGLIGPELAHGRLGLSLLQRVGHLKDTQNSGVVPPQYAGTGNNSNPFFPAFTLEGRVYSGIARKSRRTPLDGIGLSLELEIAPVRSYTTGDTTAQITSRVSAVNISALYRYLWLPKKQLSPSAEVGVGFDYFDFPLAKAQYPGTAYRSPNLSLGLTFLAHPLVAFNLYGAWRPIISPSDQAARVLGSGAKGHGLSGGGSITGRWRIFTAELAFLYKSFSVNYKGKTSLPTTVTLNDGTQAEFTNIKQTDSLKNIAFRVGVVY